MPKGRLQVNTYRGNSLVPITNTNVTVTTQEGQKQNLKTDSSGQTPELELNTPDLQYSMKPSQTLPYSLCDVQVNAEGYQGAIIKGCQIYPDRLAIQPCSLTPQAAATARQEPQVITIGPNRLVGDFPPKIPENVDKPEPVPPSGLVVLAQPVVPQYIVVHIGTPNDTSGPNYTVPYKEYVKNVACSEIFSTWPESTIRANVYCIISFTLNRIYTEWYRGKGKNFDITSSTAYDHAFFYGRNIYENISRIVDNIFSTYMKRPGAKQPLLAQYCDGVKVTCPNWLSQWGSKFLGDQGKYPYEILTYYYGSDLSLATAPKVEGIPMSYPGYALSVGSRGTPVSTVQRYLNRIAVNYPLIPKTVVDGIFGTQTRNAVMTFQGIFYLPKTGVVNYPTWYKISDVYVAVTKIAELRGDEPSMLFTPPFTNPFGNDIPTAKIPYDDEK